MHQKITELYSQIKCYALDLFGLNRLRLNKIKYKEIIEEKKCEKEILKNYQYSFSLKITLL